MNASSYIFDSVEFHLSTLISNNELSVDHIRSIQRVEAFFEASKFRGYVVTIETSNRRNNISFEYEAYFMPRSSKETIKVIQPSASLSSSEELNAVRSQLLQILTRFVVSTDFDSKERQFNNYAAVMDQKSDPALLMDFDPVVDRDIEFWITWSNPSSKRHV